MKDSTQRFDEVLRLAREIQSNPGDPGKAQTLAQQVIELDADFSNGNSTYPKHWSASTK